MRDENTVIIFTEDEETILKEDVFNEKLIKDHPRVIIYIKKSKRFGKIVYSR